MPYLIKVPLTAHARFRSRSSGKFPAIRCFMMAEAVCYAPSELVRSINQLPFPGFGAAVGNLLGDGVVSAVLGNSISVSSSDSFCQFQTTI